MCDVCFGIREERGITLLTDDSVQFEAEVWGGDTDAGDLCLGFE